MGIRISFFVSGTPQPGGSKRAFIRGKRAVVVDDNPKSNGWKADVKTAAEAAWQGQLLDEPLRVTCIFFQLRPKSHYRTGKNSHLLREDAPQFPTTKPDATKLFRSTEDAMTGVIYTDDAAIVAQHIFKRYGPKPGARITIETIQEDR